MAKQTGANDGKISGDSDAKFVLKSKMDPKGDQPQAIEKIVKGVQKGQQFQTVLGATGTGKSVTGDTPVLIYKKSLWGQFLPKIMSIANIVDGILKNSSELNIHNDTELVYGCDMEEDFYVPSFNFNSKKVELKPITAFIRHDSPELLYKVKTACGREASFTGDHNFFALREGKIVLLRTDELKKTDYIPLPVEVEFLAEQQDLETICISNYVKEGLFVKVQSAVKACAQVYGGSQVKRAIGSEKFSRIVRCDESMNGNDWRNFKNSFDFTTTCNFEVKSRLGKRTFEEKYPLSDEFLELLGWYIAEGGVFDRYLLLSVREKECVERVEFLLNDLGLNYGMRKSGDIVVYSTLFADLLKGICGTGSFKKRLPDFWAMLSLRQLSLVLKGYFAGDGGVDGAMVAATTASKELSSDLMYALNRFGIWARCKKRFKRATNSDHKGNYYYCVSISGQDYLEKFKQGVGFACDRKNAELDEVLGKKFNTNVDVIPGVGALILKIREKHNLRQIDLAGMAGLSRSMFSFIELGKRNISRFACAKLVRALRQGVGRCTLVLELESFLNLRWSAVESVVVEKSNEKFVYDFSVADNETFLAGHGGMFVHNTFTMAQVVHELQRPALVLAHNKTLAAQLCSEFQEFFPDNAVSYFVSYYDYYQPEAYKPSTDTYIEKDASINEEIDKFRHAATANLLTRRDVLIVASVSCIYGLGSIEDYENLAFELRVGDTIQRDKLLRRLTDLQYIRSSIEFKNGMFHVLGDVVEIYPRDRDTVFRIEFFGDELEAISEVDGFTGEMINELNSVKIFPSKHNVTTEEKVKRAVVEIEADLKERYDQLKKMGKMLEAERIKTRTEYDMEILLETGYCNGIENYTRYLNGGEPGGRPSTLMDYLPDDFLLFIDESHMTVPQIGAMHNGNLSRKQTLIEHGFRLPSAYDNRPLKFEEFEEYMKNTVFVSATPGKYEKAHTPKEAVAELIVRPTGLVDPEIEVRPTKGQIEDLLKEIRGRVEMGDRVLVTTLTKRNAEELSEFLADADIRVRYLHSDIDTIERIEILRDLRLGKFDVLVGINLLREGLDLPEVSLVAILDADKQGFLRSESALVQTIGRCARNVNGFVVMYADKETDAMKAAIGETERRRAKQIAHNEKHGITPETIKKAVRDISHFGGKKKEKKGGRELDLKKIPKDEQQRMIRSMEAQMDLASQNLEFEKAAELRDEIETMREEFGM